MAVVNVIACLAITVLVASQLDPARPGGLSYATWYVAAVGTLMTITSTRRRTSSPGSASRITDCP